MEVNARILKVGSVDPAGEVAGFPEVEGHKTNSDILWYLFQRLPTGALSMSTSQDSCLLAKKLGLDLKGRGGRTRRVRRKLKAQRS